MLLLMEWMLDAVTIIIASQPVRRVCSRSLGASLLLRLPYFPRHQTALCLYHCYELIGVCYIIEGAG